MQALKNDTCSLSANSKLQQNLTVVLRFIANQNIHTLTLPKTDRLQSTGNAINGIIKVFDAINNIVQTH